MQIEPDIERIRNAWLEPDDDEAEEIDYDELRGEERYDEEKGQ